jgi:hypothetical protein
MLAVKDSSSHIGRASAEGKGFGLFGVAALQPAVVNGSPEDSRALVWTRTGERLLPKS